MPQTTTSMPDVPELPTMLVVGKRLLQATFSIINDRKRFSNHECVLFKIRELVRRQCKGILQEEIRV